MSNKGIRILTQYFYPDVASTGQLLSELAFGLAEKGLDVSAITAFPSYSYKIEAAKKENYRNVNILRLWTTKLNKNTKAGQLFNSITFFLNVFFHLLFSSSNAPLLIVSNPPFLPIVGYIIKKLKNTEYIYLVHDVYPEKAYKLKYTSEKSIFIKIWKYFDRKVLMNSKAIIVLSDAMKRVMAQKLEKYNLSGEDKISVVHNWADEKFIKPVSKSENKFIEANNLQGKFVVQYSGNIGASYELEIIVETANMIKDDDIVFLFIGDGVKKKILEQLVEKYKLTNVRFLPYQLKKDLPYSLTAPSITIVTYESYLEGLLMPSKLYTNLASGVPIIALCKNDSEVAGIINTAECGFVVDSESKEKFFESIMCLKNNTELQKKYGENARKHFEKNFTLSIAVSKYYEIINKI